MEPTIRTDKPNQYIGAEQPTRLPPPPAGTQWLITAAMLDTARDETQPADWRRQIYRDHEIELSAAKRLCGNGKTIKQIVDNLVVDQGYRNWAHSGPWLVTTDALPRLSLHPNYGPYLNVAIRRTTRKLPMP